MQLYLDPSEEQIYNMKDFEQLRMLRDQVHEKLQGHPLSNDIVQSNRQINALHDSFIRKAVMLAETELLEQGRGLPPVRYSFLLFGSGGRKEQTLWSDQDNGIIYENSEPAQTAQVDAYFEALSYSIVNGLQKLGYPPCEGNVICSDPRWCKSLKNWQIMLDEWSADPNWEHIRYLLIIADFRCIHGDLFLAAKIRDYLYAYVRSHPSILADMLHNTLHRKASLGVFGQLITERYGVDAGGIDIKYGSYIPIVNGIRLLAIESGINETATSERIQELCKLNVITSETAKEWQEAFEINLKFRALTPYQLEAGMYSSRGKLPASFLTKERKAELKFCLRVGSELQKTVRKKIGVIIERSSTKGDSKKAKEGGTG